MGLDDVLRVLHDFDEPMTATQIAHALDTKDVAAVTALLADDGCCVEVAYLINGAAKYRLTDAGLARVNSPKPTIT